MSKQVTAPAVRNRKVRTGSDPLVMVTAYDAPGARMVDEAGADVILVGDSLAMVVLGYDDTLQVTVDDMAHHVAAVARARPGRSSSATCRGSATTCPPRTPCATPPASCGPGRRP